MALLTKTERGRAACRAWYARQVCDPEKKAWLRGRQRLNSARRLFEKREEINANRRAWRSKNVRREHLRKYGLTVADYEWLLAQQDFVCAVCGRSETKLGRGGEDSVQPLSVDHCHATGNVRGLLCHACNRGLAAFRDSSRFLLSAAGYLGGK